MISEEKKHTSEPHYNSDMAAAHPGNASEASSGLRVALTQEVELCGQRERIAVRYEGVIPGVAGLHVVDGQLVDPGGTRYRGLPRKLCKRAVALATSSAMQRRGARKRLNGFRFARPPSPRRFLFSIFAVGSRDGGITERNPRPQGCVSMCVCVCVCVCL